MLVLTRNLGQRILVGEDVVVTVLNVKGNQVRLGIDAARDVVIDREEVYLRRKQDVLVSDNLCSIL